MNNQDDVFKDKLIVGIDLGTTNSGIAVWSVEQERVEILTDKDGYPLTPSIVGWDPSELSWLIGREAEDLSQFSPNNVVYSIKRYIGRAFKDPNVTADRPHLPYKLVPGDENDRLNGVVVDFGTYNDKPLQVPAPDISAKVLYKLRQDAASKLNIPVEDIENAVITVPAYFNVLQRRATILAGEKAGLRVADILNEPTAAALSYRNTVLKNYEECRILVYDLGGGTFDLSLLEFRQDENGYEFYTLVVDGDTRLGGGDIDLSIVRWLAEEIEKQYGIAIRPGDRINWNLLRQHAEIAKIALSSEKQFEIVLDLKLETESLSKVRIELTREQLENCAFPVIQQTCEITKRAVEEIAELSWDDINEVILVGWQTLMPAIQQSIKELTGRNPHVSDRPELAVALGAGEYAHILSLGQAKFQENTLINVIALPLGIRLEEDTFEVLIKSNSTLPHTSRPFPVTTVEDNQPLIRVEVLQGTQGASRARDCVVLGFIEMNVLPAPSGIPKFEVVLDARSDGTMYAIVTDTRTKQSEVKDLVNPQKVLINQQTLKGNQDILKIN